MGLVLQAIYRRCTISLTQVQSVHSNIKHKQDMLFYGAISSKFCDANVNKWDCILDLNIPLSIFCPLRKELLEIYMQRGQAHIEVPTSSSSSCNCTLFVNTELFLFSPPQKKKKTQSALVWPVPFCVELECPPNVCTVLKTDRWKRMDGCTLPQVVTLGIADFF